MATAFNKLNKFNLSHEDYATYEMGKLYPFLCMEVIPGDSFDVSTETFARAEAMIAPQMSRVDMLKYYFYVPNRIVWEDTEPYYTHGFDGQDDTIKPYMISPPQGYPIGSLADFLGLPVNVGNLKHSALPFRAYQRIMYDWIWNENVYDLTALEPPMTSGLDTTTLTELQYKMWEKDYFTSALPSPQRGDASYLPTGTYATTGIYPLSNVLNYSGNTASVNLSPGGVPTMKLPNSENNKYADIPHFTGIGTGSTQYEMGPLNMHSDTVSGTQISYFNNSVNNFQSSGQNSRQAFDVGITSLSQMTNDPRRALPGINNQSALNDLNVAAKSGVGLIGITDLSSASAVSVNQMRVAFQVQKFLERNMRGGARMVSWTLSHFGVRVPDARLQRAEYLGGSRSPLFISAVEQTSQSTTTGTPQGNLAGRGVISGRAGFKKSFTEYGYIIGLCCILPRTLYSQGIERHWTRESIFEEYVPVFAHLGEQEVKNKEIYATGTPQDEETWAYQDRFAEFRHIPSRVHGQLRPGGTLNYWTLARQFNSLPAYNKDFVTADPSNRIFAVESGDNIDHFICQHLHRIKAIRPIPKHGFPGLIDHD